MRNLRKKNIVLIANLIALFGLAGISWGVTNGVKFTPHNLGTSNVSGSAFDSGATGTTETEVCIFCHTPHNARAGKNFLWNRDNSAASFVLYTSSPTLNFKTATYGTLSEVSKMCMSCHDGVTALNSMSNPKAMNPGSDQLGDVWTEGIMGTFGPNIGEGDGGGGGNLTNDHPVSFSYAASEADPTIKPADGGGKSIGGGVLPFWNNGDGVYRVECVTCHDPHVNYGYWSYRQGIENFTAGDKTLAPFLRKSNDASALCFTCHNK